MKKLLLAMVMLVFTSAYASAFTTDDIDHIQISVTTSGSAFDDLPFSVITYKGELFDVEGFAADISGGDLNWFAMLIVSDRETGSFWYGAYNQYKYGQDYSLTAKKFVILFQVSWDGETWAVME